MPFLSKSQREWAHTRAGTKQLGGKKKVAEWEKDTPKKLPKHVKKSK